MVERKEIERENRAKMFVDWNEMVGKEIRVMFGAEMKWSGERLGQCLEQKWMVGKEKN